MALPAFEFLRRFLHYVVPAGVVRIRHHGLPANRHREERLRRCRKLLGVAAPTGDDGPAPASVGQEDAEVVASWTRCPSCGQGRCASRAGFCTLTVMNLTAFALVVAAA